MTIPEKIEAIVKEWSNILPEEWLREYLSDPANLTKYLEKVLLSSVKETSKKKGQEIGKVEL